MAYLTIGDKEYKSRCDFAFDRLANEKYSTADEKGKGGTMNIYMSLLNEEASYLSAFWDCALAYLKKEKPSTEAIEEAIIKIIDEDETGDAIDKMINEAFTTLDSAGFQRRNPSALEDDGEDEQREETGSERNTGNGSETAGGRRERQGSLEDDERGIQRENGIDYDQIITNSAHWLGVYDVDLIMSWTPNEYKLLLKGKLRKIDELELMAKRHVSPLCHE